jgi:hypothetical protein
MITRVHSVITDTGKKIFSNKMFAGGCVDIQRKCIAYNFQNFVYEAMPNSTIVFKKGMNINAIVTDSFATPVFDKALVYRNNEIMMINTSDAKSSDYAISTRHPGVGDPNSDAVAIPLNNPLGDEGEVVFYLHRIHHIYNFKADFYQANVTNMDAIVHDSGLFVPCNQLL